MDSEGSDSFIQQEAENEIRPEMPLYLYAEDPDDFQTEIVRRALFDIQEKLAKKKSKKAYEDTLLHLKAMSDKLDQCGYDEKDETDRGKSHIEACLDTNDSEGMVKSDIKPAADPSATDSVTRLGQYSVQGDLDHDEMATKTADKEMTKKTAYKETADKEAQNFANYRRYWEATWSSTCGSFEHMTGLSSMQFTAYAPRCSPINVSITETMQIFSIKLAEISGGLGLPLSVYGLVAVRDVVDRNRNFLFYCDRNNSQKLTQDDPFLRLIGPSRAVVYDRVSFEIKLRVKGITRSQDTALISEGRNCHPIFNNGASTVCFKNCFCKIELCMQLVRRTTQATILGIQVVDSEQWPFKYGARVACSPLPGKIHVTEDNRVTYVTYPASGEIVMVDSKDGVKLNGGDGYLQLSRNVVSVEDQGRLDVDIQAYSKSGHIAAQCLVNFPPRFSKITRKHCSLGGDYRCLVPSRRRQEPCYISSSFGSFRLLISMCVIGVLMLVVSLYQLAI